MPATSLCSSERTDMASAAESERLRQRLVELEGENARLRATTAQFDHGRELRHQAIFQSAVDFAIVATDRDGRVTDWNSGAADIFGWSAQEMVGEPVDRFFTPEDRAADRPATEMRCALRDGSASDERWHIRKDGSRFWASGEMMPLLAEDGAHLGFLKILRDRTERRRETEAPRADAEFLRSILAASGDCIKVLDLEGNIIFMSERGQRIMEVGDFNAIRGCPWPSFWQGEERRTAEAAVEAAKAGGVGHFQGPADTMAGTPRWWDVQVTPIVGADGRPDKLLSVSRDITATRAADEAFRQAQGLNTLVLNSSRDCIVVLDLNGGLLFVSPGGIESMEVPDVEAILGRSWLGVWSGADHDAAQAAVAEARAGGVGRFRGFCATLKGTPKWWDVAISALPGPDGRPERLVSVGRDITEGRTAEEALRLRGEDFFALADNIPALAWIARADGHIYWYNRRWYEYTGTSPETQEGWGWESVHHPDALPAVIERWTHSIATGEPFEMTFPLRGGDGVFRPFLTRVSPIRDEPGDVVRWVGTNVDITEQQAAEAELKRRVTECVRERDMVWQAGQDLFVICGFDGKYRSANPAWSEALGYSPEELVGTRFDALVHPDDRPVAQREFERIVGGASVRDMDLRLRGKDGVERWFSWHCIPEGDRFYAAGRDVTGRRQLEEQLRQAQKMEAVGQLTGGLAHDFNNLLTGITGSLELLQARIAQGRLDAVDRYVSTAQGAARRAAALTQRLLAFSRRQTLDPKAININRMVADMEELIRRTVGPAIAVEVVGAGGLWPTLVDPNQLENALLNLCINARDAMPGGGRLTIETANKWLDERAAANRELPPGQFVSLCVTDTGTGMTPDVVARAFDPFFTTKPLGEGTGLGLSMVYGFVRQSGGQVRIYSEIGEGTTMCLYLPRHLGPTDEAETVAAGPESGHAQAGETVLVVDDEPTVRMLITEILEDLGYTAIEAGDGAAGLKVLQSDVRIDLLITDVGLPGGMNGRQVADAGRAVRPELKVLFITGYAQNAAIGNGHLGHGMQVLTKPFAMDALATKIREIIEG